ncbi:MAG: site-2 protease family protein [Pirellulales bacterium]
MLLTEPSRSPYDLNFSVLGIPVRVHPFFWLVTLLLGLGGNDDPKLMILWVGACFVSILVHEMGHALAARSHGWEPWITLYGFGGLASYRPTYYSPRSRILISMAGPGAGFLFALAIAGALAASGHQVQFDPTFSAVVPVRWEFLESKYGNLLIFDLFYINIFWGLVNLLPIYPLDGGQITREVFSLTSGREGPRQSLVLSIVAAGGLAAWAFLGLGDQFLAIFFGYLAYTSYTSLRGLYGPGGGLGGYR